MLSLLKSFMKEEDGLGTVEMVILIAVLVGIALLFRKYIINFVQNVLKNIFGDDTKNESQDLDLGGPTVN